MPLTESKPRSRKRTVLSLLQKSSAIAGAAGTAAVGALAGDPFSAAAIGAGSTVISQVLQAVGGDLAQRLLGEREEVRVGAAMAFALERIQVNVQQSMPLRRDGFFETQPGERTAAEEILEGVLLAAQREHEERKVRFEGYLFANIAFRSDIDRGQANSLINMARVLTFRQLCLLHLFQNDPTPFVHGRSRFDPMGIPDQAGTVTSIIHDIFDLDLRGLIGGHDIDQQYMKTGKRHPDPRFHASIGQVFKPRSMGLILHDLMDLREIDDADLEEIRMLLPQYRLTREEVDEWAVARARVGQAVDTPGRSVQLNNDTGPTSEEVDE